MNIADGKSEAPDFERQFLGELSEEVVSFRTAFESLVGRLQKHAECAAAQRAGSNMGCFSRSCC